MWPLDWSMESLWLALYLLTWALHAVFVSFVAIGTGYALVQALRRADDPLAERVRDWLPFMLGAGITAGVAPLLFVQLLYQRRFYTANLLLGPRWGAVVPALIIGFYALYLAKASVKWRRPALAIGVACFAFVAWSWTELHLLMLADPVWRAMYAAGDRLHADPIVIPRLAMWLGCMAALFAIVAAYLTTGRRRLAVIAIAGIVVAVVCAFAQGFTDAHGWTYLLIAAAVVTVAAWAAVATTGRGLSLAAGATAAAVLAGAVVREAPRLAVLEPVRANATEAGGAVVFMVTLAFGIAAFAWIVRTVRSTTPTQ